MLYQPTTPISDINQSPKRIWQFEFLRVLACLSVVFLHSLGMFATVQNYDFWGALIVSVSSFGVPIFVMISGYFLLSNPKNIDCSYFYKKRLKRIGIPLLFWSTFYVLHFVIGLWMKGEIVSIISKDIWFRQLYNGTPGTGGHLWYLFMIVGLYIITPFLLTICKSYSSKNVLFVMVVLFLSYCIQWNYNQYNSTDNSIFCILLSVGYTPYFFFGKYLGDGMLSYSCCHKRYKIILLSMFLIAGFFEAWLCKYYNLHWILGKFYPLIILQAIIIYLIVLSVRSTPPKFIMNLLNWISSLSFGIYLFHYFFVSTISFLFHHIFGYEDSVLSGIVVGLFSFTVSAFVTVLFKKTPFLQKCV